METKATVSKAQKAATKKVLKLKEGTTSDKLADMLGIAKPTLYTRLERQNWKKTELALINLL